MSIRGIAFDLEGTVVDIEVVHYNSHLAAAADFGCIISLEEAYTRLPHFIGGPTDKVCEDIVSLLNEDVRKRVAIQEVIARDIFHYERQLAGMPIIPRPGFLDFCEKAQNLGLSLAIGSLTAQNQADIILERSGLAALFHKQNIILREHVAALKPAPDVFLKTASIMKVDPCEQLVFEDSPRGVKAAIAAGSIAIGMPVVIRGDTIGMLVDAGASRIFFDWREINLTALLNNLDQ